MRNPIHREDYYVKALQKNVSGVREFAAAFTERFGAMPFPAQRQVILHFVEKMKVVDRKAVELTLRVPFDNNGVQLLADETPPDDSARAAAAGQIGGMSSLIEKGSRALERLSPFQPGVVGGAIPAVPPTGGAAPVNRSPGRRRPGLRRRRASFRGPLRAAAGGACSRRGAARDHGARHERPFSTPILLSGSESGQRARGLFNSERLPAEGMEELV